MRKIRKRVFAAVLAAAMLFTTPGMASVAAAAEAQTEDISESVTVQADADGTEQTETDDTEELEAETETIQESEAEDGDKDQPETGDDDTGDTETDAQESAEDEQELTTDEQEQSDISPCLELQEALDAASVPAPIDEPAEGTVAKVETSDGTIVYLGESDFAKAFDTYYNYNNVAVTLLSDIQPGSIDMGDVQARVHIFNTCTLDLAGHTIANSDTTIYVWPSGNLTIMDSSSGKTGQVVSTGGAAILTQTGMVSLIGGTYTGNPTIDGKDSSTNVSSLLANYGTQTTPHYAYFNAQGNPIALEENQRELIDTVTVRECSHPGNLQDNGNGTHGGNCPYCGAELAAAPHTLGDGNVCEGCNTPLKVQVEADGTITYYSDLDAAWTTAYSAQSAEVTLLADVTETWILGVGEGDKITLNSGIYTLSIVGFGVSGDQLDITRGTFKMRDALMVSGGTVRLSGGEFSSTSGEDVIFCEPGSNLTVGDFLLNHGSADPDVPHYAYYKNGKPLTGVLDQTSLAGPVTVAECNHAASVCEYQHNDGTETHTLTCLACGYTEAADCTFGTEYKHDDNNHTQTCTLCGYEKVEAHTFHFYSTEDNGLITFMKQCMKCNYRDTVGTATLTIPPSLIYGQTDGKTISLETEIPYQRITLILDGGEEIQGTSMNLPAGLSARMHSLKISIYSSEGTHLSVVYFTIDPAPLTEDMVTLSGTEFTYSGAEQKPDITVKQGETTLAEGTDYEVSYSRNDIATADCTNVGTVMLTVNGKGNYDGKVVKTFTIARASLTIKANDQDITFGQDIAEGFDNMTVTGLCMGDSLKNVTLTPSTTNVPGGDITPSDAVIRNTNGQNVTGNYQIAYQNGVLTINKADAAITVGTDSYNKTYGARAFALDVIDDNPEMEVQYEVTDGADVVTVSEDGTVAIRNAGTAAIIVSLPASANYNAAEDKTITVNVAQKEADTVRELGRSYLYSVENADTIDLSALLPVDCGSAAYEKPQTSGAVAYSTQPAVDADGKLTYTLKSGSADTEGTITVTVKTRNYTDISFTVKVKLTDKRIVRLKAGKEVTLKKSTLTYGEALSKLTFKSTVFVDDAGKEVKGTLAWKDAAAVPNAGTASAVWVFTPSAGQYAPVEGLTAITVNKAVPVVSAVPTVEERVYNPSLALKDIALSGGAVTGVAGETLEGIWSWKNANVIPAVDNGRYETVFMPEDVTNYETAAGTVTVTVTKAAPYIAVPPTAGNITYGDTLDNSRLSAGTVLYGDGAGQSGSGAGSTVPVAGTFTWEEPFARPVAADSNQTEYTVVFKPSDTVNYTTATGKITLAVDKAQYAPGMPNSAMDVPNVTGKVGDVSLPESWQWQEKDRDKPLIIGKSVSAAAVYTGADKGNYETETVTVAITSVQVPDGLWISGLAPSVSYTGSAVKPVVKVYHGSTLLREKTDYTISYKNNTKAGTAQITVTGKGSYKGKATQTFTIEAVDLSVDPGISAAIATAVETGKNLKPAVTVTWNGKKLKEKTDYTLSYEANIKTASAEGYDVTITGKGNYTGVIVEKFHVTPNGTPLLNKATVKGLAKSYPYRENRMPEGLEAALENITVKVGKTTLAKEDYIVRLENVSAVGTGIVVIEAAPGSMYAGQKRVTFNITGASLKKGSIIGLEKAYPYTGSPVEPEVKVYSGQRGTGEQIPSDAYTVSYSNSVGNGKAKVTVTGIAAKGYSGSLSATYTIGRLNIEDDGIDVEMSDTIEYAKGGAKPQPVITHTHDGKASVLREGVDYTLKYSNNTSAGGTKKPAVKITGTGNYCGTVAREYVITGQDISRLTITAADKAYNSKKKGSYYYSAPKVYDLNGKLLKSGTDYTVQYFDASTEQEIGKNDAVAQGAEIRVTVTGKGSYRGTLSSTYRILAAGDVKDISKAKNDKITNQPYTGAGIQPEIRLYTMTGKTRADLNEGTDYEIIGFYNNIKKGTATVLIKGKGTYSGVKSITFKIVAVDNSTIWKGVF